ICVTGWHWCALRPAWLRWCAGIRGCHYVVVRQMHNVMSLVRRRAHPESSRGVAQRTPRTNSTTTPTIARTARGTVMVTWVM
ncbi:MAG: hypothetical protein K2M65_05090, partial [Muribaculaceae bacterium]|nr:hypothetical protein [Muribaculaceae bacterium]